MNAQQHLDGVEPAPRHRSLGFKAVYIAGILDGTKTTTIRAESNRLPQPGDELALRCRYHEPAFAHARCTTNDPIALRALTDEMARADGHRSARELRAALRALYPGQRSFRLIGFELL